MQCTINFIGATLGIDVLGLYPQLLAEQLSRGMHKVVGLWCPADGPALIRASTEGGDSRVMIVIFWNSLIA